MMMYLGGAIFLIFVAMFVLYVDNVAYADDFTVDAKCMDGYLFVTIHDDNYNAMSNVDIRMITDIRASKITSTFETDAYGSFILPPYHNTGFAWITSPGYNDQKISTSCAFASSGNFTAAYPSKQLENYCYDYLSSKMPIAISLPESNIPPQTLDDLDSEINVRDMIIYEQVQMIRTLLDYDTHQYNATFADYPQQSSSLCLENIKATNSLLFEIYGMMYAAEQFGIIMPNVNELGAKLATIQHNLNNTKWCNATNSTSGLAMDEEIAFAYNTASLLAAQWSLEEPQIPSHIAMRIMENMMSDADSNNNTVAVVSHKPESYYLVTDPNSDVDVDSDFDTTFYFSFNASSQKYDDEYPKSSYNYDNHNYNERYTSSNSGCYTFCDSDDYEPGWARYLSKQDAVEACWDVEADVNRIGTDDWYWCKELERHVRNSDK